MRSAKIQAQVKSWAYNHIPGIYGLGIALGAIATAYALVQIPADPKNQIFFGFSLFRLVTLGVLLLIAIASLGLAFHFWRRPTTQKIFNAWLAEKTSHKIWVFSAGLIAGLGGGFLAAMPSYWLGEFLSYHERLAPILLWIAGVGFFTLVMLLLTAWASSPSPAAEHPSPFGPSFVIFLILLGTIAIVWGIVAFTRFGIGQGNNFWNKAGTPILTWQIILIWLVSCTAILSTKELLLRKKLPPLLLDGILCLALWISAILIWNGQPLAASRFNTPPYPPNYEVYPFSDAADYNVIAQSILSGQKIDGSFLDKSLFYCIQVILHLLAGQNFNQVILAQIALLAMIPVLLYCLGRILHSRALGIFIGMLVIAKESNAIAATNLIQVSNVKMMMSEMPTALGLIAIAVTFALFLRSRIAPIRWLYLSGGLLGLAAMIRLNVLVVLPFLALLLLWQTQRSWKTGMRNVTLVFLFVMVALTPWMIRNAVYNGNPLVFMRTKTYGVMWVRRYSPIVDIVTPTQPVVTTPDAIAATQAPAGDGQASSVTGEAPLYERIGALVPPILSQFFHNLVATSLMLPASPVIDDLEHSLRLAYWDSEWHGSFVPGGVWVFFISLFFCALGCTATVHNFGTAGLVPLMIYAGYNLSTAAALTSGGRYIVPIDWVLPFYFAAGVMELTRWSASKIFPECHVFGFTTQHCAGGTGEETSISVHTPGSLFNKALPVAGLILFIGALPIILEHSFPVRYPPQSKEASFGALSGSALWHANEISQAGWQGFLSQEAAVAINGRALFPRYYLPGQSDTAAVDSPFGDRAYPRLVFVFLEPREIRNYMFISTVMLPLKTPPASLPNASDVIVLGCRRNEHTIDAVAVILLNEERIYSMSPELKLTCTLP